jgi:hypothetical protein
MKQVYAEQALARVWRNFKLLGKVPASHFGHASVTVRGQSVHYSRLREAGHSHGRALRGVCDRLISTLRAVVRTGIPYTSAGIASIPVPDCA